ISRFSLCHRFGRPAGACQGIDGQPGRKPNQARGHHETRGEFSKENSRPARARKPRRSQTRLIKFHQTVKRTTRSNSFIIVKTVHALLILLLVPITATRAQAPPVLSATNANASAATNAAATNLTATATNDLAARRRALEQSLTNRLSRTGTNQLVFPAFPAPPQATNAAPFTAAVIPINPALGQATNNPALAGAAAPAPAAVQPDAAPSPLPTTATSNAALQSDEKVEVSL